MSAPPEPALGSCASCAEVSDTTLWCARCHTVYCSRPCQVAHWAGEHKKACKGIARARRDTNRGAQSRALARVSHMSGGAPGDARCMFCLDWGDVEDPILRGCACRGSTGWTHIGCLVKMAEAAPAPTPSAYRFAAWHDCSMCKQHFTGQVALRLAIALWTKHARAVETDEERLLAAGAYAIALGGAGEDAEAARLQRGILDVSTQMLGPEHHATLVCASNLAGSLVRLGECAEAAALLRTTLTARTRTFGADNEGTLFAEGHLAGALLKLGEFAEAEALGRRSLEKIRRILGRDHRETLVMSGNLAISLSRQGKRTEAAEIQREVLASTTRLLGAEHEKTLISASNLAVLLWHSGQKTEGGQILSETLAVSRRTLGPAHKQTERLFQGMHALGLAVP